MSRRIFAVRTSVVAAAKRRHCSIRPWIFAISRARSMAAERLTCGAVPAAPRKIVSVAGGHRSYAAVSCASFAPHLEHFMRWMICAKGLVPHLWRPRCRPWCASLPQPPHSIFNPQRKRARSETVRTCLVNMKRPQRGEKTQNTIALPSEEISAAGAMMPTIEIVAPVMGWPSRRYEPAKAGSRSRAQSTAGFSRSRWRLR